MVIGSLHLALPANDPLALSPLAISPLALGALLALDPSALGPPTPQPLRPLITPYNSIYEYIV